MPPGYEVYKEEDKNLLIGDNHIAPVTQEFGGLGTDVFILPDQSLHDFHVRQQCQRHNPTNYQNQTQNLSLPGKQSLRRPGLPRLQDPLWPCVR